MHVRKKQTVAIPYVVYLFFGHSRSQLEHTSIGTLAHSVVDEMPGESAVELRQSL